MPPLRDAATLANEKRPSRAWAGMRCIRGAQTEEKVSAPPFKDFDPSGGADALALGAGKSRRAALVCLFCAALAIERSPLRGRPIQREVFKITGLTTHPWQCVVARGRAPAPDRSTLTF